MSETLSLPSLKRVRIAVSIILLLFDEAECFSTYLQAYPIASTMRQTPKPFQE